MNKIESISENLLKNQDDFKELFGKCDNAVREELDRIEKIKINQRQTNQIAS